MIRIIAIITIMVLPCVYGEEKKVDENRIVDAKYDISFPPKIGALTFHSMSIDPHYYEVRYSSDKRSQAFLVRLLPNEKKYPIYNGKALAGYTKPVSDLTNSKILEEVIGYWKSKDGVSAYSDKKYPKYPKLHYYTYILTSEDRYTYYVCLSVLRMDDKILIVTRYFDTKKDWENNYEHHLDEIMKCFTNR